MELCHFTRIMAVIFAKVRASLVTRIFSKHWTDVGPMLATLAYVGQPQPTLDQHWLKMAHQIIGWQKVGL